METTTSEPDHRQLRRDFQSITEGTRRFDNPTQLLETYTAPLARIFGVDTLPASLKTNSASAAPSSSNASRGDVDVLLVEAVQESLVSRIVLDFSRSLEPDQLQELVKPWFFGLGPVQDSARGTVQQCALRTLSRLLSSATSSSHHPITLETLKELCVSALTQLSLPALISAVLTEKNRARADVIWTETLRLLSSLPDRLANAYQGHVSERFSTSKWIENVLVSGIADILDEPKAEDDRIKLLKDVLGRLDKMAYLTRAIDTEGRGFWVAFLEAMLTRKDTAQNWPNLRARLGTRLRTKLDLRLVETLQYLLAMRQELPNGLVTTLERTKPGSEGTAFLSKTSQTSVASLARVFGTLFKSHTSPSTSTNEQDSYSSESDEEVSPDLALFKKAALSRTPQSPILAWSWCTYFVNHLASSDRLVCLENTLRLWCDPSRLSHAVLEEEFYLTTLILTLLATLTNLNEEDSTRLAAISRSKTVLDGVSNHLSHTNGTTRILGMLVAEVVSSKIPSASGKVLNFGKGVWNGSGNGREECRVLRALHDAWSYHDETIREIDEDWADKGFVKALEVLGITATAKAEQVGGMQVDTVSQRKKTSEPKSRRLPERIPPPTRSSSTGKHRPLITMIDSDTEDQKPASSEPLSMFNSSKAPSRARADSVSSSSSSSDGSDSDIADSTEADIQKLAAELSGLTPGEASSALASNPSLLPSTRKPKPRRTRADEFDQDQEAHAPTFSKPSPAPVYISQLSPLLKSSNRADIKLGLKHAAALIRLKSHMATFGNELRENAVDLTLTLIALHDNYRIRGFEKMRVEALTWMVVGAPSEVVGVLGEQMFGSQYSGVQRIAMLAAMGEGALELSGKRDGDEGGSARAVRAVVDEAVGKVIAEAREVGESKVPALRRQRNLEIGASNRNGTRGKLVQIIDPSSNLTSSRYARGASADPWESIVGPFFLFPFINRFLAYHYAFSLRSHSSYLGAGTSGLFSPEVISLFLDTLTLLLSLSPATLLPILTGSLLELILVPLSTSAPSATPELASTLDLLALLLHRNLESDEGESLLANQDLVAHLRTLLPTVQELFAALQNSGPGENGGQGGVRMKILSRAAAVLLLLDRLDQQRQQMVRRLIGFVPS